MYDFCTAAILRHQAERRGGRLYFVDVDMTTGARLNARQDELAAFFGGLLAQGGHVAEGRAYTRFWSELQDRYGVLPEEWDVDTAAPTQAGNALRPNWPMRPLIIGCSIVAPNGARSRGRTSSP